MTPTIRETVLRIIGDTLSKAHSALLAAIYGLALTEDEQEVYCRATGRSEYIPRVYRDCSVIAGRRSGKSSRIAANIAVHEACVAQHSLPPGERGTVLVVGPVQAQARITFNYIRSRIERSKTLRKLIQSPVRSSKGENVIELSNGIDVRVVSADFRSIRGTTVVCAIFEEAAFYRDETGANPFSEILSAVRPGMLTVSDSKLIRVSSPWAKSGQLWDDFRLRDERPETLCWKLPSWEMNPDLPADELARERERDEAYFLREYGAEFLDAASALLPTELVEAAVVKGKTEFPPQADKRFVGSLDAAFKSDAFAFSIAHIEGEMATVDYVASWKPRGPKQPVRFDAVMPQIIETCKRYRITQVFGDQVCAQPIREALERAGIRFNQTTTLGRRAGPIFSTLRAKVSAGQLRLPDQPELVSQLKRLELVVAAGGYERVEASSGHDDIAISAALAVHQAVSQKATIMPWVVIMDRKGGCDLDGERGWLKQ